MHYFTPAKALPEGTIYLTDLTQVADFADWLAEFGTLLNQNHRFATVCTPMQREVSDEQRIADRKDYIAWIKAHQTQLAERCAAMLLIEPDAAQLEFFREQSSKLASALGVNYIAEADEVSAMRKAEEALKAI
ncbi:extensin [Dentiradicibacter hellwigii]|uniref:Extensin n=1 Tax=Dentiradicibacter hellwigii TaxID=3149053 RepID=A0ABV4UD57_9RHOO|nr:extensin [uncultured Neisseria sp.]